MSKAALHLARVLGPAEPAPSGDPLFRGRLIELSGEHAAAQTTVAVSLLRKAQSAHETAAWVQPEDGPLFVPDLADSGVDLAALLVVHVPKHAGPYGIPKAAELLLRSGAIGMVVLDLWRSKAPTKEAWLSRLLGLARKHDSSVILLTNASPTFGSLVSLRIEPQRTRVEPGLFAVEHCVLKDKSGLSGLLERTYHRGPWGLK